ncbi:MAG: Xaa-Pro peptidase family protein [Treponema sp.]|jgi:Xaa-Pro aminopeptidase|nr:Xaa-Pro peptidase family protein [Treponema sp.]
MDFTPEELRERRRKFTVAMEGCFPGWDTAIIMDNVNQYYFTGTMQDGILLIFKDGSCLYGIRRSYDRAKMESPFLADGEKGTGEEIVPIPSYRDLAEMDSGRRGTAGSVPGNLKGKLGNVYIEGDTMPAAILERLQKYFEFSPTGFFDRVIRTVRSVKSPAELRWIELSGRLHREFLEDKIPGLLREGMRETEFLGELTAEMYRLGYQGIARFHLFQTELITGQIGFGANSLYPSRFDGPGGTKGNSAAAPFSAGSERKLKKGDAVFVDIAFGMSGYHSDKTQVYFFGAEPPEEFRRAQQFCVDLEKRIAARLKPGEIPSKIYQDITGSLSDKELDCFMGVDNNHRVKFLGHGVGLNVDELPLIARGFDEPLEENMVIALEPKKGVPGIGMAGVEDTYIVKDGGGRCVTGEGGRDIIRV